MFPALVLDYGWVKPFGWPGSHIYLFISRKTHQAFLSCICSGFGTIPGFDFGQNVGDVVGHGSPTDEELICYLLVLPFAND